MYSGVLSYFGSEEANRVTRQCVRTYRATPPPVFPVRSCRRRLYPDNCMWESESWGVRKVSVMAMASTFFVKVCASNSEKCAYVDNLFILICPRVKRSILGDGADGWTSNSYSVFIGLPAWDGDCCDCGCCE